MADHPDLILAAGPVLTMDPAAPGAEALALHGASTQTVDLAGQCVLPASSRHTAAPPSWPWRSRRPRWMCARSPSRTGRACCAVPAPRRLPPLDSSLLDELSPDAPLGVFTNSGHGAFANSAALHAAGITRDTPDPAGALRPRRRWRAHRCGTRARGYLFVVDRKKDLIIRGRYNMYPREVEEVLHEHSDPRTFV